VEAYRAKNTSATFWEEEKAPFIVRTFLSFINMVNSLKAQYWFKMAQTQF